ncbi:MAG: twin-arginine translocase TatA/TatE family subunit [Desulfarculaceae bacterium]|jgi:sec-independent protein translocase protein TatB
MFGIGMPELIVILLVALLVVGPRKLPDLARSLGKGLHALRSATDEIKEGLSENEAYQDLQEIKDSFKDTVDSVDPRKILDVDSFDPMGADSKDSESLPVSEETGGAGTAPEDLNQTEAEPDATPAPKNEDKTDA